MQIGHECVTREKYPLINGKILVGLHGSCFALQFNCEQPECHRKNEEWNFFQNGLLREFSVHQEIYCEENYRKHNGLGFGEKGEGE